MIKSLRLRYFLTHLLISAVIASMSLGLVLGVWYEIPLAQAVGVGKVIIILLCIDVILGPLLTLIVAKENKTSLKFDLIVIALLQFLALSYGLYTVSLGKPVWIVFDQVRFELVQKHMVMRESQEKIAPQYQKESWFKPQWVAVRESKNAKEQNDWLTLELTEAISPAMRPVLYTSLSENMNRVLEKKISLDDLKKFNELEQVQKILEKYSNADGYLPLKASEIDMVVLVDSKDKNFIQIVDLRPW